jgi:hypothetical protein
MPIPRLRSFAALPSAPLDWLWPGYPALGNLAILEGDPGLGKSLVTLDIAARLSTGRPMPDGAAAPGPADVLLLSAEDDPQTVILPRLHALGADLGRVHVFDAGGGDLGDPVRFPSQVGLLDDALAQTRARLVILDPVKAFLDRRVNTASDHSVRSALLPLAQLARKHHTVPTLVRHLNKTGGRDAIYRGTDSRAFTAACRSGWLVARDPQAPGRCVLAQVKNNLAPPRPSLAYTVQGQGPAATVSWLGPCAWTADQLVTRTGGRPPADVERAAAFLMSFLEEGPRNSREVWARAREHDLSESTLRRAKAELGVRSERVWADGRRLSYWLLPGQKLPRPDPEDDPDSLEPWLAPLREKYPSPSPLDDL